MVAVCATAGPEPETAKKIKIHARTIGRTLSKGTWPSQSLMLMPHSSLRAHDTCCERVGVDEGVEKLSTK